MITIDGHTFDESLLSESGWVIDAGCRGFAFPQYLSKHKPRLKHSDFNYCTYCIDIEAFEKPEYVTIFKQAALTNYSGQTQAYHFGNGTGNFIKGINETPGDTPDRPCLTKLVQCITLEDIYNEIGTDIDLLKLDIEGCEYLVLENFEPIPKQITVEFHEHVHKHLHDVYFDGIFERLCKDYKATLFISEWPQYKYMDCLFVRKDLL